jgi:choline dehydrogenase-like flavoprotein
MTVISPDAVRKADVVVVDVVVIGSGPGGSVTAATLAQAGREVLLIEEGQNLSQDSCAAFSYEEMKQKYRAGGITVAMGSPNIAYAEGSCVGGGSEVNSGLYHRLPNGVITRWADDYDLEDFSVAGMTESYEACEQVMRPAIYPGELPVASKILRRGAELEKIASADVPRLVTFGADKDEQGVEKSQRHSMSKTYLPEFYQAGGKLLPDTRVERLARQGGHWQVHAQHKTAGPLQIDAENVFVCAGAVHSPALLQRSGLRTNAGKTFSMQPMVKLTAEFNEDVNFVGMGIGGEQIKEFSPSYSFGCAISSRAHLAINLATEEQGSGLVQEKHRKLVSFYVMSRGALNGSVKALPRYNDPLVRYKISDTELQNLGEGMQGLAKVLFAAGATRVFTGLQECSELTRRAQVEQIPNSLAKSVDNIMTIHMMASCPMGGDPNRSVVDSWGRVHGQSGLYVADVSILCSSPGVNPQGTIMALAKRNSDHFLRG